MTLGALALLVVAAIMHASWNLLAKRASDGGAVFVWLFTMASTLLYAPLVAVGWLIQPVYLSGWVWLCVLVSAAVHTGYFLSLQTGYRHGDLSLVYPLARGTGPLLATILAMVFLAERPSLLALAGGGLIIVGVFMITGGMNGLRLTNTPRTAIGYGVLAGAFIGTYTLVDKYAVAHLLAAPLVYHWLCNAGCLILLSPWVRGRGNELRRQWQQYRAIILAVGLLSPLTYILVLLAMQFTPLSHVAPAREISILVGVILGARLLAEGQVMARLLAALAIVVGIAALVLG